MKKSLLIFCLSFITIVSMAQKRQITGQVLGAKNDTLIGVVVTQKGTTNAAMTDIYGNYSLSVPDTANVTLVVSLVGYREKEIPVGLQTAVGSVTLDEDAKILEDVVIVGYGVTKKSDLTGAVTSFKGDEIKQTPTTNIMESVQGKAPGVDITRSSGSAGAKINVTVRGNRSINAGNTPLYIVDGVQYTDIQDINPNDIQSMEVLKDASSTAIYGSRGSNGVIIVTTKRGAAGTTRVFVNSYTGVSTVAGYPRMRNGKEYVDLRREANRTTGLWKSTADDSKIFNTVEMGYIADGTETNFTDELLHNGLQQDFQAAVSGGTDRLKSYLSLDYFNEKGLLKMDQLKRYTGRVNLDFQVNRFFKVGTQTQLTYYNQSRRANPLGLAAKINPLTEIYDANGDIIVYPLQGKDINPLIDEEKDAAVNNSNVLRVFPTIYAEVSPFKNFTARTNLSMNLGQTRQGIYNASYSVTRNGGYSQSSIANTNTNNLNWQAILNYTKQVKDHSFVFTGISEIVRNQTEGYSAIGQNQLLASQQFYNLSGNTQNISINSNYVKNVLTSFAGRINYNFKNRYLLTVTARTDGASQLAEGHQWDYFPSLAAGWRLTEERFMKNQKVVSNLKLRASYGISGNASVAAYSSQNTLTRVPFAFGDNVATGFAYNSKIGNPDLRWEKSTTLDIGVDFGILKDRITGTIDVYDTHTNDLILDRVLPASTGVSLVTENVGKTRNRGIEVGITGVNIQKKNFTWSTTLSYSKNKEEILELVGGVSVLNIDASSSNPRFLVVGSPVNSYYDYEKVGIWQLDQADEAATFGQKPGDVHVKDQNGDGKITTDDRKVVGSTVPKFTAGLNNEFKYKNWDLSFYIYARVGQMFNYNNPIGEDGTSGTQYIYDPRGIENGLSTLQYWTPENPTNELPRPNANLTYSSMQYFSTVGYTDGSFVKLRNVSIGYTFPERMTKKIKIQRLKLYVTGKNLITLSKVKSYDPEMSGNLGNPTVRLFVGGINIEF
jgi:TonB-linked SusC/RagA family outer membrane protein